jgi:hypothetical protein
MAQTGTSGFGSGPTLPVTCSPGDLFASTNPPSLSLAIAVNQWATIANVVGEVSAETTSVTPLTVLSFPVATSRAYLMTAEFSSTRSDWSTAAGGTVMAMFVRASGNVSRSGAQVKTIAGAMNATVDLVANIATQSVDVQVRGEGANTDNWRVRLYAYNYRTCSGPLP